MNKGILFIVSMLLTQCSFKKETKETSDLDYDDFANLSFDEISKIGKHEFQVYFYLPQCTYCQKMKNEVLEYAIGVPDFYLTDCTPYQLPICSTERLSFCIYGTPSLAVFTQEGQIDILLGIGRIKTYLQEK